MIVRTYLHRHQRSHHGDGILGDELHDRNVARTVPEDRQSDVLCKVHTQGRDVVLRKRYKAAGDKKAISVQRLNILAIDSLVPDLDKYA